ncbi:MAG: hypothetical protein P1V81_12570 [Planctomycetota bacterium]|nr:hypothetical protein [Planctomycetota bacterium]
MNLRLPAMLLASLALTSCGPYYVGRAPIEPAAELMASLPKVTPEPTAPIPDPVPSTSVGKEQTPEVQDVPVAAATEAAVRGPAIGWDGKDVVEDARPLHELEADAGSRGYLIDLYVKTKERVDELELEVEVLRDLQLQQEAQIAQRDSALTGERTIISGLEAELEAERERNVDLEARLVTAQIRRLEAERQLLLNLLGEDELPVGQLGAGPTVAGGVDQ